MKRQSHASRLDERLGEIHGRESTKKQSMASRRHESEGEHETHAHHKKMHDHHMSEAKKHAHHLHKMAKHSHHKKEHITAHDRAVDRRNLSKARKAR